MSIITKVLRQTAVYWPPATPAFDQFGQPCFDPPVLIKCRWEETQEEFISKDGTKQISKAKIMVDRDLSTAGVVMQGRLEDIVDVLNPKKNPDAWEIKSFGKIPNLRNTEQVRTVYT